MSERQSADGSSAFARLDELLASSELWIDRADEAAAIATAIRNSPHPIIVLIGAARAGKSELARRWIEPALSPDSLVVFHDQCGRPDVLADPPDRLVLFWDAFDVCLADEVTAATVEDALVEFASVKRAAKVVLLVRSDAMTRLAHLSARIHDLFAELHEVPPVCGERIAGALRRSLTKGSVEVPERLLEHITRDLDTVPADSGVGSELVGVLAFEVAREVGHRQLQADDYDRKGRLAGLLVRYLDFVFEHSPPSVDPQVAWAVLQEATDGFAGDQFDPTSIAHRFGIAESAACGVLTWIETDRRLLRRTPRGRYALTPPQLALAVDRKLRMDMLATEPVREALRQGVRYFIDSEALLTPHGFKKVHAFRTAVTVTSSEAQLMLRCALAYETDDTPGAVQYWLRRIPDTAARVEVLFDATFDPDGAVRRRAVEHLHGSNRPEIRSQLHLLALRDPFTGVREAAVNALADVPDPALRDSLLREVAERSSPYRLNAITALRIFTDPATTAALVSVVRDNAAGADLEARQTAIAVLGGRNTASAARSLVDIALDDPDAEDRTAAQGALVDLQEPEALDATLTKLRERRRDAVGLRFSFSWRRLAVNVAYTGLALLAVAVNMLLHGFLLFLVNRRHAAAFVFAAEVVGAIALQATPTALIVWLALTFFVSVLMVLRTLLRERIDLVPQGHFRRCLSWVLFVLSWVPSVYLPGLDSFLTGRLRRGMLLFGFEVVALLFLFVWNVFERQYGAYIGIASETIWFDSFYYIGGILFVLTYLVGLGSVFWEAFLVNTRRPSLTRIDALNAALLENRKVCDAVLEALDKGSAESKAWAKRVSKRFAREIQPGIRERWPDTDAATRRNRLSILVRQPDPATLAFLRAAAPALGWPARVRTMWAGVGYRFSVWPKPLLLAVAMVVYALVALTVGQWQMAEHLPANVAKLVRSEKVDHSTRAHAVEDLVRLSNQTRDAGVAHSAALELAELVSSSTPDPQINAQLVDAAVRVAPKSDKEKDLVLALAEHAKTPQMQERIVTAFGQIGTATAVQQLREFIGRESVSGARTPKEDPGRAVQQEQAAKLSAIKALGQAQARDAALDALMEIAQPSRDAKRMAPALAAAARTEAEGFDPLVRAEYLLRREDYEGAVKEAEKVWAPNAPSPGYSREQQARTVLMKAYTALASIAVEDTDYPTARDHVQRAIDSKPPVEGADDLVHVALAVCFGLHEYLAPKDPAQFGRVYETLTAVRPFAETNETRESVLANLVESSLTTGRYDETLQLAQSIVKDTRDAVTILNMKFFMAAALLLKGDAVKGRQALDEVNKAYAASPSGFKNSWTYAGTTHYIRTVDAPAEIKNGLLQTLTRIQTQKP